MNEMQTIEREPTALDASLGELRATRRIEQVAAGIERFLLGQFSRLEKALEECERAAEHDQVIQRMLIEFDQQKQEWEEQREQEAERLKLAYGKLMDGWKQLEEERREILESRNSERRRR